MRLTSPFLYSPINFLAMYVFPEPLPPEIPIIICELFLFKYDYSFSELNQSRAFEYDSKTELE